MRLSDYQKTVQQFLLPSAKNREYLVSGLGAEAGEVLDVFAKAVRDNGGEVNRESLKKELGDVLFFVCSIAEMYNMSADDIAVGNINKLRDRKARNVIQGSGDER